MKKPARLALFAAATLSGCWDVPPGDQTSPYFWSQVFLDKYADERVVGELEPGPAPLAKPRTVLLITGVTIEAEWFDAIVARLQRDGFIPVVYEPPALLSGSLFQATVDLAAVVEKVCAESGQDKIDILAECTGGLIARHYVQSMGGDQLVSRLVTFVSPQHGVAKAPLAALIAGWPALDDLSPGSAFLEAVNGAPLPAGLPVTSIYTCTDEYIQPYTTSIIPGATNIGLCDGFVGHFQTFYDPSIYLVMHGALTAPIPGEEDEVVDEPPVEEPTTDEPPVEEPAVEEPAVEEPAVAEEEPTTGDAPSAVDEPAPETSGEATEDAPASDEPADPRDDNPMYFQTFWEPKSGANGCTAGGSSGGGLALGAAALALLWMRRRGAVR